MAPSNIVDIAANLPSLQFENALSSEQLTLLPLRTRMHALTSSSLANSCHFVSVMNLVRNEVFIVNNATRAAERIMQYGLEGDPAKVGFIGCGRFGRQLVRSLITHNISKVDNIFISTRRPETLVEFYNEGISVQFNNAEVVLKCDIIFLCCLPAAITQVASEIKRYLTKDKVLYSFVSGLPGKKLRNLLNFTNIIKPEYFWTNESSRQPWDISIAPISILSNRVLVDKFCPLSYQNEDLPVWADLSLVGKTICSCINYATTQAVTADVVVDICNKVFFLMPAEAPVKDLLIEENFNLPSEAILLNLFEESESEGTTYLEHTNISMNQSSPYFTHFPYWNITEVGPGVELLDMLQMNKRLRKYFIRRYCSVFEKSIQWT